MRALIRRIRADEGRQLRAYRLRALAEAPMAFGSSLAHEQGFPDGIWNERAVGAATGCDRATFIAERDGQWVGMVTGLPRDEEPEDASKLLVSMFVDMMARRSGIGVKLVDSLSAWAAACGADRMMLWVTDGNDPALALYRRCGFRPTGVRKPLSHTPTLAECEMILRLK